MRRLRTVVHVEGHPYGPGDVVPEEIAARITNPDAWADDEHDVDPDPHGDVHDGTAEKPSRRTPRRPGGK